MVNSRIRTPFYIFFLNPVYVAARSLRSNETRKAFLSMAVTCSCKEKFLFSVSLLLRRELSLNFKKRKQKINLMSYAVLVIMKETGTIYVKRIEGLGRIHNSMITSFS